MSKVLARSVPALLACEAAMPSFARLESELACAEVVYRCYHGAGPIRFELAEVGGRGVLRGEPALQAFHQTRKPSAGAA